MGNLKIKEIGEYSCEFAENITKKIKGINDLGDDDEPSKKNTVESGTNNEDISLEKDDKSEGSDDDSDDNEKYDIVGNEPYSDNKNSRFVKTQKLKKSL